MIYHANILLIICKSRKRYECSISYCNNIECQRLIFGFQRSKDSANIPSDLGIPIKKASIITLDICMLLKQGILELRSCLGSFHETLLQHILLHKLPSGFLQLFNRVFCLMILVVPKQTILNNKMLHVRSRRTKSQSYYTRHHYEGFTLFPKQLTHLIRNVHISLSHLQIIMQYMHKMPIQGIYYVATMLFAIYIINREPTPSYLPLFAN